MTVAANPVRARLYRAWSVLHPCSNAERFSVDYKLDVRFRLMLRECGIPASSRTPYEVIQGIVGTRCVSLQEGFTILPSAHAIHGMAAIDMVKSAIRSLNIADRMPKDEGRMLQLVHSVFTTLPAQSTAYIQDAVLERVEGLVESAANPDVIALLVYAVGPIVKGPEATFLLDALEIEGEERDMLALIASLDNFAGFFIMG